jgi:hypothetical protein
LPPEFEELVGDLAFAEMFVGDGDDGRFVRLAPFKSSSGLLSSSKFADDNG